MKNYSNVPSFLGLMVVLLGRLYLYLRNLPEDWRLALMCLILSLGLIWSARIWGVLP